METITTVGVALFMVVLILNAISTHMDFKDLKKMIIFDEVILLITIFGANFWAVAAALQKFKVSNYEGAIVISIAILISLVISRVSVLTGERKQILKEMLRVNEVTKGD